MATKEWLLKNLAEIDLRLRSHIKKPLSLSPRKQEISSFKSLGEACFAEAHSLAFLEAMVHGLTHIVEAQIYNFPDNIFWDWDFLVSYLFTQEDRSYVETICHKIAHLQARYGIHSSICFRYVHDFNYGFDWARWVAKAPEQRRNIGPFALEFLLYLEQREGELLELIRMNDQKYPQLPKRQIRNPFNFNREPFFEKQVHEILAQRGFIPVPAWQCHGVLEWNRDYTQLREDIYQEVLSGLSQQDSGKC